MPGPPKKPTQLKKLQGTYRPDLANLNEPTPERGRPSKPAWLKGEAAKEYKRLCDDLDSMRLLTAIDRPAISMIAEAWAEFVEAAVALTKEDKVVRTATGHPMPNPWLGIKAKAAARLHKLLVEYGLTPASRPKVSSLPEEERASDDNPLGIK